MIYAANNLSFLWVVLFTLILSIVVLSRAGPPMVCPVYGLSYLWFVLIIDCPVYSYSDCSCPVKGWASLWFVLTIICLV